MGSQMSNSSKSTVYFGYGSNLWLHQMDQRCPTSKYLGVARLNGYRWIINDRGYANVVETARNATAPEEDDAEEKRERREGKTNYTEVVFGLVYSLQAEDERRLDKNEGVPVAYTKEHLDCDFWASKNQSWVDVSVSPTYTRPMLVYIDRNRTEADRPKKEYIYRMNRGIDDAIKMGVPEGYVKDVMRKFIEEEGNVGKRSSIEELAKRQALDFVDENVKTEA